MYTYLKCHVGVSWTDWSIINQSLYVVHHNTRHGTLVSVIEDLPDGHTLGRLRVSDHVLRAADLDEREARVPGNLGSQSTLAGVGRPLKEDGDEARSPGGCLLDRQLTVLEDVLHVRAPVDNTSCEETCIVWGLIIDSYPNFKMLLVPQKLQSKTNY